MNFPNQIKKIIPQFICSVFVSLLQLSVSAQNPGAVRGYVYGISTEPIAHATVSVEGQQTETQTNEDGYFILDHLPIGTYSLYIRMVGYQALNRKITVDPDSAGIMRFTIIPNPQMLSPVTVTAEKKQADMQKVPLPLSVISGRQIEERNIREVSDLLLASPNTITFNAGAPTLSLISIRGVATYTTDPAIGVYVDGVPMFDGYSSSIQLQNIDRVEVLRGPQSTLYGRTGLGGVINIITRSPANVTQGFASVGLGNYGSQQYGLGLSGPLVKNKLFAGISGLYDTRNGYFENLYTGKDFDKPRTYHGDAYVKYLATERLTLTLNAKAEYNNVKGSFPYALNADSAYKNGYTMNQNGQNIEKRKLYTTSLAASYRIPFATLQSITGFTNLDDTYKDYDNDLSPYAVYGYDLPLNNQKTVTQEFRIVTADDRSLQFTGGIFGFTDLKKADNRTVVGSDAALFGIDAMAPYTNMTNSTKKVYGLSGYANLSYAFAERWNITGGLRYDYESRRLSISNTFVKEPDASETSPEQRLKGHNHSLSPRFSLSYAAGTDVLFYASFARGFRAGGFNQFTTTDYLTYDPEYSDNVELGAKTEWLDHRLRANVNIFYTNWKDQQQALIVPDFYIANIGRLVNQGAELELSVLPVKGLEINYNLGLFHSEYKKLILTDYNTGENMDARGNRQVFAPAVTSSLNFTYRYHLPGSKAHLFIVPEWKYLSKQYLNFYNDLEQSPFSLFNLSGGVGYKAIELAIWVKNLADKRYIPYAYMPSPAASAMVLLSAPRTYGLTLRTRF